MAILTEDWKNYRFIALDTIKYMINYISNQKCGTEKISSKIAEYILRFDSADKSKYVFYDKYEYLKTGY